MTRILLLIGALLTSAMAGCAGHRSESTTIHTGARCVTSAASTDFYRYGPQQSIGPDRKISRNTGVTVTGRAFGYARVKLASGEEGYVAQGDLLPAPAPTTIAQASPSRTEARIRAQYTEPTLPPPEPARSP